MSRWGLRLMLLAVVLFAIGFSSMASAWFEVARVSGAGVLALGIVLLLIDQFRAPTSGDR